MIKERHFATLIDTLEQTMKQLELWQTEPPSEQALQSVQPFSLDTLAPEQWLQWVFIAKLRLMLAQGQPLPSRFEISPYFFECWKNFPERQGIIAILQRIDRQSLDLQGLDLQDSERQNSACEENGQEGEAC